MQHTLTGHGQAVTALAALPGASLASADGNGAIKIWRDGRCIGNIRETSADGHDAMVHCLHVHHLLPRTSSESLEAVSQTADDDGVAGLSGVSLFISYLALRSTISHRNMYLR